MANWLNSAFYNFDYSIAKAFNGLVEPFGAVLTPLSELLALLGKGGVFLLLVAIILSAFRKTRRGGITMLLAIGIGALFTNVLIKNLVARPRPYLEEGYKVFWEAVGAHAESEYSFPSGHTTVTFTSMTALFLSFNKKWSFLGYVYATLTGLSRIYLVVHYSTDVIGGCAVGVIAGIIAYFVVKFIYRTLEKNLDKAFCRAVLEGDLLSLFNKNKQN